MLLSKEELSYLMKKQDVLDNHVFQKHGVDKTEVLNKRKLAAVIEFSEFVNDWQQFKYWKVNNEPKSTMVEEFVDALHFSLSLANDLVVRDNQDNQSDKTPKWNEEEVLDAVEVFYKLRFKKNVTLEEHFFSIFELPSMTHLDISGIHFLSRLLVIGKLIGLSSDEIMKAYEEKNKVNFERQENNY